MSLIQYKKAGNQMKKTCIVLIGPPCSGKSTVGKAVESQCDNVKYISSGDIARRMAKHDKSVMNDLNEGKLAPEDKMRRSISNNIFNYGIERDYDIIILDGFPRFSDQAEWLEDRIGDKFNIYYVLMDVSYDIVRHRAHIRNRADDINIERRIDFFNDITLEQLHDRINYTISAGSIDKCSNILKSIIKEVSTC